MSRSGRKREELRITPVGLKMQGLSLQRQYLCETEKTYVFETSSHLNQLSHHIAVFRTRRTGPGIDPLVTWQRRVECGLWGLTAVFRNNLSTCHPQHCKDVLVAGRLRRVCKGVPKLSYRSSLMSEDQLGI